MCGSLRKDSLNRQMLRVAAQGAIDAGGEVTYIDLGEYPMPFYCADAEAESGLPTAARKLQIQIAQSHALLIASPEYNGGYTAVLKNTIDWVSRPQPDGVSGTALYAGKVAAVISASPGPLGGLRSQTALRTVLEKLGMLVIPESFALGHAHEAWFESGELKEVAVARAISDVGRALQRVASRVSVRAD
ncbi:FMN reductase [Pandoraea cepalis]|uniref:FMN reductase n=1 Tax=Pandoraea cepalis TaxID=2508294 RepID=A0AAW7MN78_9BURK|nr:FMN reductase [Pandoraea cepalis]MDN4579618.1 FMN reductase [Pandoraea cepalis]